MKIHIHLRDGEGRSDRDNQRIAQANALLDKINLLKLDPLSKRSNTYLQAEELKRLIASFQRVADPIEWK